jgi:hypothetical protein
VRSRLFVLFCLCATVRPLLGSCGSASCPLDLNALNRPVAGHFAAELSFEYIDQDQPRIGTRAVAVGALPAEHDQVRTVNRSASLVLRYAASDRLLFSATVPYVSHDHLRLQGGVPERWNLSGIGDTTLQVRGRIAEFDPVRRAALWGFAGVKLPTGANDRTNSEGEVAEIPIQPGTGSTDTVVGLEFESGVLHETAMQGPMGSFTLIPMFASIQFRRNTTGAQNYRVGNELQLNGGTIVPLRDRLQLILQANAKLRSRDVSGDPEDHLLTGGRYLFLSPGLRVDAGHGGAWYAMLQIPVYQHVNGIQLTAKRNLVTGVQMRF